MTTFHAGGKEICVYPAVESGRPIIYLNTFAAERKKIHQALLDANAPDFTLAAIGDLDWDHDMAPWDIPPISKIDTPCTGGADDYLKVLTGEIVPAVESELPGTPCWRGIAGYSLAGLFAVYALYRTDMFSRVASMSGSLWFPGLLEYLDSHEMARQPDCAYFSLGDKEAATRNRYLQCVQKNTEAVKASFANLGIDTAFVLNPGNHYQNPAKRAAAGINWILTR